MWIYFFLSSSQNPTDEVSLEVQAAEKLFYEEKVFKIVVYTESALLIIALVSGLLWEVCVRNKDSGMYVSDQDIEFFWFGYFLIFSMFY